MMEKTINQPVRKGTQNGIKSKRKSSIKKHFQLFYKQNKEIVHRAVFLLLLFLLTNVFTALKVRNKVSERLELSYQERLETELASAKTDIETRLRLQYGADQIDEKTAKFNKEVEYISKILYPYLGRVSDNSLRSGVWCVLSRVQSRIYPDSIEDVVLQENQWTGFSTDNPVVKSISDIVSEQLEIYYSGKMPLNPVYTFATCDWKSGEITLRDSFSGNYHIWNDSDWMELGY